MSFSPIAHDLTRPPTTPRTSLHLPSHLMRSPARLSQVHFFAFKVLSSPQSWPLRSTHSRLFSSLHWPPFFSKNSLSSLSLLLYLLSFSTNRILLIPFKDHQWLSESSMPALLLTSFHLWICNIFILTSWKIQLLASNTDFYLKLSPVSDCLFLSLLLTLFFSATSPNAGISSRICPQILSLSLNTLYILYIAFKSKSSAPVHVPNSLLRHNHPETQLMT